MKVLVRADGGGEVGWGHLGRSVALAEVLEACGAEVSWACRPERAVERLVGRPPDLALEGAPTLSRLARAEAEVLAHFARGQDWVIVDHYGADAEYLGLLKAGCSAKLMIFDDHQERHGVDLRLAPMQGSAPKTLSGAAYQPVRACFSEVPRGGARRGWLLALGGADPRDDMRRCLEALLAGEVPLTVLASDAIAERQALDPLIAAHQGRARRVAWMDPELARTLAASKAALVSASTLSWEALATRTPIVALEVAENQAVVAATLGRALIPTFTDALEASEGLLRGLASLPHPEAKLDGLGAWRVARAMGARTTWPSGMEQEERA